MRELTVIGLDVDGKHVICESTRPGEKFLVRVDERLRAVVRAEGARSTQSEIDIEVTNVLSPKEIQARIRAGASVEQVAASAGVDASRVERFAHPVLLERSRAAELATASHPVLADGPSVQTLLETVAAALVGRGLDHDATTWDAWKNADGRWTVQLTWQAGRSQNAAHFRFTPGAHGGTATALDDAAKELIDPNFDRPLRPVAPVAQLDFDQAPPPEPTHEPTPEEAPAPKKPRRRRPAVPALEDVLLDVRSGGDR
ncbi:MAG: septation protein SepH [Mycobacterium sp.]